MVRGDNGVSPSKGASGPLSVQGHATELGDRWRKTEWGGEVILDFSLSDKSKKSDGERLKII